MVNTSKISNWLKSGEYLSLLDSVLTKIIRDCERADSEAHTSAIFEAELRKWITDNKRITNG